MLGASATPLIPLPTLELLLCAAWFDLSFPRVRQARGRLAPVCPFSRDSPPLDHQRPRRAARTRRIQRSGAERPAGPGAPRRRARGHRGDRAAGARRPCGGGASGARARASRAVLGLPPHGAVADAGGTAATAV